MHLFIQIMKRQVAPTGTTVAPTTGTTVVSTAGTTATGPVISTSPVVYYDKDDLADLMNCYFVAILFLA